MHRRCPGVVHRSTRRRREEAIDNAGVERARRRGRGRRLRDRAPCSRVLKRTRWTISWLVIVHRRLGTRYLRATSTDRQPSTAS